jgi:hypothetical protein
VLAEHARAEREQLARVMAQPPAPRYHTRARHTAGGGTPR